jgi:hypothetical protein
VCVVVVVSAVAVAAGVVVRADAFIAVVVSLSVCCLMVRMI